MMEDKDIEEYNKLIKKLEEDKFKNWYMFSPPTWEFISKEKKTDNNK
mgnify:CR=1 FL=1